MRSIKKGLVYTNDKCIGCNKCIRACSCIGACVSTEPDENGKSRIMVDGSLCVACGLCAQACPEGFRMGESGLAAGFQELPDYAIDDALQTAEDCPIGAIEIK